MKYLIDYKDDIHKCSKCGLCQSVCPVYEQTGNDCAVSRGKFIMLNGVVKGDLKLNKNINKYLDMCLKCNACKDFCPSDIDARKIFLAAKAEYFNKAPHLKLLKALNAAPVFNLFLNSAKAATNIYRLIKLDKLAKLFYPILKKFRLGKKVILANEFISGGKNAKVQRRKEEIYTPMHPDIYTSKIIYFKGCVNEYINPKVKNAAESILNKMGVQILKTHLPLQCCGIPFLSGGNVEQFVKQAEFNLAQIPDDFDYFLTDCATCQSAFKDYEDYIKDEALLKKLKNLNEKSINIVDFILQNIQGIEFNEEKSFTFHKPCHLEDMGFLNEFLAKTKNVKYIEMKDFDKCCGFSGEFAVKNMKLSEKISSQKVQNVLHTKAEFLLTACPSCILGLKQGLIENKAEHISPYNLVEFIALADKIY